MFPAFVFQHFIHVSGHPFFINIKKDYLTLILKYFSELSV